MRIPMSCSECVDEEMRAEAAERQRAELAGETVLEPLPYRVMRREDWYRVDLDEDNAYLATCRNGHTMKMALQNVRYELLFESGAVAMLVGFQREAVSSIAAALERFFEFSIEVFVHRSGVDRAAYDDAWKLLHQSERQLGAFLFLYLTTFKRPFLIGRARTTFQEWTKFRNDVIHAGEFPTSARVHAYAQYVYDLIRAAQRELRDLDENAFQRMVLMNIRRGQDAIERRVGPPQPDRDGMYRSVGGGFLPMMLNSIVQGAPDDFESRLAETRNNLWLWGF